jgi:hypothetical protein
MHVLIVFDPQNTFLGTLLQFKQDGDEFGKQAMNARKYYGRVNTDLFELPRGKAIVKRHALFRHLRKVPFARYDRVLFFCHGHPRALNRRMISDLNDHILAELLDNVLAIDGKIMFFACRTGKHDDGFAAMQARMTGKDIIAHTTRGHTTINPHKVFFDGGSGDRRDLWDEYGGVKKLKKRLKSTSIAPFEFAEEIFDN